MKKKIIYIVALVIVLILGYFNYFAEDKEIDGTQQVIETTNVTYKNDDYEVEAEKQKDYVAENETGFEKAKAKVNDMLLSGDNVFIDKVRNLALKNNILGVSQNGWTFKTQSANYDKADDRVSSDTGVEAENKERGIKISGKHFTTNSKMSFIDLKDNVVLENKTVALRGDSGKYDDTTKIVDLAGNITVEGRGKEEGLLDGHFQNLKYNMNDRILKAWEPFDIIYKGVKLSAENLYFKEDDETLKITENVKIFANGFDISVASLDKAPGSNILKFNGKISGNNGEYSFVADSGTYNTQTKILEMSGDIIGKSVTGDVLVADRIIYDTQKETLRVIASDKVKYTTQQGELVAHEFIYSFTSKELITDGAYSFKGKEYESEGKNLYYNDLTKDIKLTKGFIYDKIKKEKISGDTIVYNRDSKDSLVEGDAHFENREYALAGNKIEHNGKENMTVLPGNYTITYLKDGSVFKGTDARYNDTTAEFTSTGPVTGEGKNYIAYGKNIEYNTKTGFGKFNSNIVIENPKDNIRITGDNFTFQNEEYMEISGNLKIETEKFVATSESGKYVFNDKKIYVPEKIDFKSYDGKTDGTVTSGVYSTVKNSFYGKNFNGKSEDSKIRSNSIEYFTKEDKVLFIGNVVMENPESVIRDEKVEYYPEEEKVKLLGNYVIDYKEFKFKGINGVYNNKTGMLHGEKSIITSLNGDRFESDRVDGNFNDLVIDFSGNIKGHVVNKGEITNFKGDFARLYFKHGQKYEVLRSEIRNNAEFIQENKKLQSDYIEVDAVRKLVYSKDKSKLTVEDKNGTSVITSDSAEMDIDKNSAVLTGHVKVDNLNKDRGMTKITSDRATIDQKKNLLEFTGNVNIENDESIVQADKGIYNTETKKINAVGNVYVNYKR